jgi:hypothetical protein
MKTIKFSCIAMLALSLVMLTTCKKDDDTTDIPNFEGSYVITSAKLTSTLNLATNEMGVLPLPVDHDITDMIKQALLGAVACSSPDKSLIELREDKSLYLTCEGEDTEINGGTWQATSATVLKLNMNSTAIPSSPTGIVLEVKDVTVEGNVLSGNADVPLAKAMLATMVGEMSMGLASLDMDATPEVVMISIAISFTKK